jgi:L-asparagine transporter-like permease
MSVTGLFATAGATNGGLYPAAGLCEQLASTGQFPPLMARKLGGRASVGLLLTAGAAAILALGFSLSAIASIGSAAALAIFMLVTIAHVRVRHETGARLEILLLGILTTGGALLTFIFTTLKDEPASIWTLVGILVLSAVLEVGWKRTRDARRGGTTPEAQPAV